MKERHHKKFIIIINKYAEEWKKKCSERETNMKWQRTVLVHYTKWAENGRSTAEENKVLLWESTDNTSSVIIILCDLINRGSISV